MDEQLICELYQTTTPSTHKLAKQFSVGHKKISEILVKNNIKINPRGASNRGVNSQAITDYKQIVYPDNHIAVCIKTGITFNDANNYSGALTTHIKKIWGDVNIPTNEYQRKKFEFENGRKWYEEFFRIEKQEKKDIRQCKLCDWSTTDINNLSGSFLNHLKTHSINLEIYITKFPDEAKYHQTFSNRIEKLKNKDNLVRCMLCNQLLSSISNTHLKNKHGITQSEYKLRFPNTPLTSNNLSQVLRDKMSKTNKDMKPVWSSKGELELKELIGSLGFNIEKSRNRGLLNGMEIDLVLSDYPICFEYNGLYYHTEAMGKAKDYHLNKTKKCAELGYTLYQIFEDEWILNKELVKNKIKHILGVSNDVRIGARKCTIKKIDTSIKSEFLKLNHIQGNDASDIHIGAYHDDILMGVMCFKSSRHMTRTKINKPNEFELSRFATKIGFVLPGLASKMFNWFRDEYKPNTVISFADRRWTPISDNNLYIKLGFDLVSIVEPSYCYYNSKVDKYRRFHKFGFGKKAIARKFPDYFDPNKTERELMMGLGYSRIWDCGLFKYEKSCE